MKVIFSGFLFYDICSFISGFLFARKFRTWRNSIFNTYNLAPFSLFFNFITINCPICF
ncbi:hypothetical protein BMETH_1626_0 [methanotrophic bacterial endosymbiont of Bathymodiolus sp.]|nr:hypothetical protein BMETH_1626_0 [methanotrophic bacterial endosymbiont of Bathymodiolus sp.]